MKRKIYLIGNAHLDPVWQWRWTEGVTAVKQTVRAALDRMDETPDFVFTSSQAVMYRWLSECAPSLLEEVRERVKEGRYVICGGQYVQPDCNIPSGESFARHALYSQRLFENLLGTSAVTAYNVDSFGHNAMLPQILKKSGMSGYVMMRPMKHEKELCSGVFNWRSPDGSEIPVFRIPGAYCNNLESEEDALRAIEQTCEETGEYTDCTMFFYGVGNHGGGPTKKNIAVLRALKEKLKGEAELVFASPDEFFKELRESGTALPVVEDDLQHHASGCYSAVSEIKRLNRRCESELYSAEVFSAIADRVLSIPYPTGKFAEAWENVLFNQFHDSLGGCSYEKVYEDAYAFANEALSIASKAACNATQALSWAVDTHAMPGTPVIIFNPHPWEIKVPVQLNYDAGTVRTLDGKELPVQKVHSQAESCFCRADAMFVAEVPPMGYSTYLADERNEFVVSPGNLRGAAGQFETDVSAVNDGTKITVENEYLRAEFDTVSGLLTSLKDKQSKKEIITAPAAVPMVIDETEHDTWSHGKNFFDRDIAVFECENCKISETGPVRATVRVDSRYGNSKLTQYFSLVSGERMLRVRAVCDWRERHKMLKMSWPCKVGEPLGADYEIPFGFFTRPCDGEEECGHRYVVLRGDEASVAILNDSKYSFSVKGCDLRLTVLRSPIYGDHGGPRTEESEYTDQGLSQFFYTIVPGPAKPDYAFLERRAAELNCPPTAICENNHKGTLPPAASFCSVDAEDVDVTALKRAEDGGGWIIRAYETAGHETNANIRIGLLRRELPLRFGKFEARTLFIPDGEGEPREVMFTESEYKT